jgi:hypothetical protein
MGSFRFDSILDGLSVQRKLAGTLLDGHAEIGDFECIARRFALPPGR